MASLEENTIDITKLQGEIKLIDYKHNQLDATLSQTVDIQNNTQKQLNDFIDVATAHFAQARVVHKIVYGVLGAGGTGAAAYFLPKLFDALIRAIS